MEGNTLNVSGKELFYAAMLLGLESLVNVAYSFPAGDAMIAAEIEEAKRGLHKKRLLKENSRGEIKLDCALSLCAAFCSKPESCSVVDEGGIYGTIYRAAETYMFLERTGEDTHEARWFKDTESLDGHIRKRLSEAGVAANARSRTAG
jgi:hypothetical protein